MPTGDVVKTFYQDHYANSDGATCQGAKDVRFNDDRTAVIAEGYDGGTEVFQLPDRP